PGFVFDPSTIRVTVSEASVIGQDFTARSAALGFPAACSPVSWQWRNPSPQGDSLSSVWGSAPDDVWAVGNYGAIVHWNGSAWSSGRTPTASSLGPMWGSGPSDVWAVGSSGAIVHWDGGAWSSVPSGTDTPLRSIWGSGPGDVWAVGGASDYPFTTTTG